ncbi:GNAT family N-acetyltransferase [Companilactobacillus sp. DQM5]|uniref:GNAT family N-acetyltransferase n=1 Tax=Companilactobacillus sp. DQM5 TaxID=3463359 RepID=UPI00405A4052
MSDELIIRPAIPDDSINLVNFYKKIQNYPFLEVPEVNVSDEDMKVNIAKIYDSLTDNLVVAINDDQIIGFSNIDNGELGIVVDKEFWNFGVGSELMIDTIDWFLNLSNLEKIWLEVYLKNESAIHLYEKFGFITVSKNDNILKMELKKDD